MLKSSSRAFRDTRIRRAEGADGDPAIPPDQGADWSKPGDAPPRSHGGRRRRRGRSPERQAWGSSLSAGDGVQAAASRVRDLVALPYEERLAAVETDPRCQTEAFCRLLLGTRDLDPDGDPDEALLQQAELAVWCAEHLQGADSPTAWDLRAAAEARAGNVRRAAGERWSAGSAFDRARRYRLAGSGCAVIEAEALAFEALLLRDRGRLSQASRRLEGAFGLLDRGGSAGFLDPPLAAAVAAHQGWCLHHLGRYGEASAALRRAGALIDEAADAKLAMAIRQGEVWSALQSGDDSATRELLHEAAEQAGRLGSAVDSLRLCLAEAHLLAARGETPRAQQSLSELAQRFFAAGAGLDGALALFDLAALRLDELAGTRRGESVPERTADLGDRVLRTFRAGPVPRSAIEILVMFRKECLNGNLTPAFARELARSLERVRRPGLAWWSGRGAILEGGHAGPAD